MVFLDGGGDYVLLAPDISKESWDKVKKSKLIFIFSKLLNQVLNLSHTVKNG